MADQARLRSSNEAARISRTDETDAAVSYQGWAFLPATTSEAKWRIARIVWSTASLSYADGNGEYDNVWDNRASLSYL